MLKGTDKRDVMRRQRCSLTVTKVKTASTDDKTASMDNKTVPPDDKTEAMFGSFASYAPAANLHKHGNRLYIVRGIKNQ